MANMVLVTYKGANVWTATLERGNNLKLVPGVNAVEAAKWAQFAEKNTVVKSLMSVGTISVARASVPVPDAPAGDAGTDGGDGGPDVRATLLGGLKTKEAVALVEETFDVELLNVWKDAVKDKKVAAAIAKQLDTINGEADKGGDGE